MRGAEGAAGVRRSESALLLGIEHGVGAHGGVGPVDGDGEGVEVAEAGCGSGVEGKDVIGCGISGALSDFRFKASAIDEDLAAALVGEGLEAEAASGDIGCSGNAVEEGPVVVVELGGLIEEVGGCGHVEGDLALAKRRGDVDEVVKEVKTGCVVVGAELLFVEKRPSGADPDEDGASRGVDLLGGDGVKCVDGMREAVVEAGQLQGRVVDVDLAGPGAGQEGVIGGEVLRAGVGMKGLCEGLEVSQDCIAAGRDWKERGSGASDQCDGDWIGKRIGALLEEVLDAFAVGAEVMGRTVDCIEQEDDVGRGEGCVEWGFADRDERVVLVIEQEGEVSFAQMGDGLAGGVADLDVENDAVLHPVAQLALGVSSGDELRGGLGWRWGGLSEGEPGRKMSGPRERETEANADQ